MGKRGPKAKLPGQLKPNPTGVRLAPHLREKLNNQAIEHDVSLSEEISRRLEHSFNQESGKIEEFGDYTTYAFCRLLAAVFSELRLSTGQPWHRDRFTFGHASDAADFLFKLFLPSGRNVPPADMPMMAEAKSISPFMVRIAKEQISKRTLGPYAALAQVHHIMLNLERKHSDPRFGTLARDLKARLLTARMAKPNRLPLGWLGDIFLSGIEGKSP